MSKTTVVILSLLFWVVGIGLAEDSTVALFSVYLPPVAWWNVLVALFHGASLLI